MMTYQFRCPAHGISEIKQRMTDTHEALCPICQSPTQRIYSPPIHYWPDVLWNKDGSKQNPDELPPVPNTGTKYFPGFDS